MTLTVLAAVVGGTYVYLQVDDEIRQRVETIFARHYTHYKVRVASAQLHQDRGIEVRGLSISDPNVAGPNGEILVIDELFLACTPTIQQLVQDQVSIDKIVIRRPKLRAVRRGDGKWNVAGLFPFPKVGTREPEKTVEGGVIEIVDTARQPASQMVLRNVNVTLKPQTQLCQGRTCSPVAFRGVMGGDFLQRIDISGLIDPNTGEWQVTGTVDGIAVGPELIDALPSECAEQLADLRSLQAQGKVQFRAESKPAAQPPLQFNVACQLSRGRIEDARLPFPLVDVEAQVRCGHDFLAVEQFTARHGQAEFDMTVQQRGLSRGSPLNAVAHARKVGLDRDMVGRLPEHLRVEWKKFSPEGEIDVDLRVAIEDGKWRPEFVVHARNGSLTYHKFPYRVERCAGSLAYFNDKLSIDLTAHSGEQPIRIQGELRQLGPRPLGWVEMRGSELPVDERLIYALPPKGREIVQSLNPSGNVQFYWRGWRDDPQAERLHAHLLLSFNGGSIRYNKFPYPLVNVRGNAEMRDDAWTFRDLEGTNDTGFVTCQGRMTPVPGGGHDLALFFAAAEAPLEEELRDALQPAAVRLWNDLKPRGRIDLTADVRYLSQTKKLDLVVRIEPQAESTSIEPVAFPYRLENIEGSITYHNGAVDLGNLRARHGATRLAARGHCEIRPDRSWFLNLEDLAVDRLTADRDLLMALSPGLRRVVGQLNPTGAINVRGEFGLSKAGRDDAPLQSKWDVAFNLHRSTLDCGVKLDNVHGEVRLAGTFDGVKVQSRGELAIDSLTYHDIQFTEVFGPLWIDPGRVLLGMWAEREQGGESRRLTAKVYGGTLVGDGWVVQTPDMPQSRYALQASLGGVNLAQIARASSPASQKLRGQVFADVELHGAGRGTLGLAGSGHIQLRDADIYELPAMMQLLKVINMRAPDASGFNSGEIKYRVEAEHVYIDQLDLLGDAVNLYGKGEMGFNKEVKLSFHSIVGRNDLQLPVLRSIVGEASGQIMQIHVEGPIDSPKITKEAFPVVNQAIQQLQAEMQSQQKQPTASLDPRSWFRPATPEQNRR